jgi:RHS repeat-associated protein
MIHRYIGAAILVVLMADTALAAPAEWRKAVFPVQLLWKAQLLDGGFYRTGEEACRKTAPPPTIIWGSWESGWLDSYLNPRPTIGGCLYRYLREAVVNGVVVGTIEDIPDAFFLNWTAAYEVCPQGYIRGGGRCEAGRPAVEQSCSVGNPVKPGRGDKRQLETDYAYSDSSVVELSFRREYVSWHPDDAYVSPLGRGWFIHTYGRYLQFSTDAQGSYVIATRGLGDTHLFTLNQGVWRAESYDSDQLVALQSPASGWQYTDAATQDKEFYDATGKLLRIESLSGVVYSLSYSDATTPPNVAPKPGLLLAVASNFGPQLTLRYSSDGLLDTVVDPAGGETHYGYETLLNGETKLVTVTHPDGSTRRYHYEQVLEAFEASLTPEPVDLSKLPGDIAGRNWPTITEGDLKAVARLTVPPEYEVAPLTGITDENGKRFATWAYDALGRAISSSHADGADLTTLTYNADGSTTVTNALEKQTTYHFATVNGVKRVTAIEGHPTAQCAAASREIRYDINGFRDVVSDFKGNITDFDHDSRGLEVQRTEAKGTPEQRVIQTQWHATLRLPTCRIEPRHTTSLTYDTQGRLLEHAITDTTDAALFPDGASKLCAAIAARSDLAQLNRRVQHYTYNAIGLVESVDGPRNDVNDTTTYNYDDQGNLIRIKNALNQVTELPDYDANGHPKTVVDPNGLTLTLDYDARGRLASRRLASETTLFNYDDVGQLTDVTLPNGAAVHYDYDAAHRLTDISDQRGNRIHYTLDAAGNRRSVDVFDPSNVLTATQQRVYDELSRLVQTVGAQNQITDYAYDNNDNLISINDPLRHTTLRDFDALNRLVQITDPANGITEFRYDAQDHLSLARDPRQVSTQYVYDGLGNLREETSADRGVIAYTYDAAGNMLSKTDARPDNTTTYRYDALNRLSAVDYADGSSETYTYDVGPNAIGRLSNVTDSTGSIDYGYDAAGRLSSKAQKVGYKTFTTRYSYDAAGRIATLTYPSGMVVGYGYDGERITSLTVNGAPLLSTITYQPFGPVSGWTFGNGAAFSREFDRDGRLASQSFADGTRIYTFDDASHITKINDPNHNLTFSYDELDRLVKSTGSYGRTYRYDANGNRSYDKRGSVETTYDTDPLSNRLLATSSGGITATRLYDETGNTLDDGSDRYTYDARGRLIETRDTSDTLLASYKLNAFGQRVYKKKGSTTTYFVYDEAGHLIGEYKGSAALSQETVYLGDIPVATWRSDGLYYIQADHLNTPRVILDQSNRIVWLWKSEPFGSQNATQDPDGDGTNFTYNLRFPGQYFDQETGLFYNYFRDYDPRSGRYLTSDPIGLTGGLNTYAFVGNDPINWIDPLGLESVPPGTIPGVPGFPIVVPPVAIPGTPENQGFVDMVSGALKGFPGFEIQCFGPKCFPVPVNNESADAQAPGCPTESDGFIPKKNWDGKKVKNPNGPGYGYPDKKGNVWVPTGPGPNAHGGPHWDVQRPGGGYINVYPGGRTRP